MRWAYFDFERWVLNTIIFVWICAIVRDFPAGVELVPEVCCQIPNHSTNYSTSSSEIWSTPEKKFQKQKTQIFYSFKISLFQSFFRPRIHAKKVERAQPGFESVSPIRYFFTVTASICSDSRFTRFKITIQSTAEQNKTFHFVSTAVLSKRQPHPVSEL